MINGYSILNGAKYFVEDRSQNYFIFQPLLKYFNASRTTVNAKTVALKSKGLSDESIKPPAMPDNSCSTKLDYFNNPKFQVKFNGSCVTIDKDFHPNKIINLYFVFEIKLWPFYSGNGFILKNSLLGAVKLKKKS